VIARRIADGAAVAGAAVAGIGVYGLVLWDLPWEWAVAAVVGGLSTLCLALLAGGRLDGHKNSPHQSEKD
jgi:hypothetical protein